MRNFRNGACAATAIAIAFGVTGHGWAQTTNGKVRAVVEAAEEAVLVASLQQRLTKIPKRPGENFKKGDEIIQFDCSELRARRTSARSVVNTRALELKNKRALRKLKAIGRHEVAMAQSQLNEAAADAKIIGVQLSYCTIKAPFAGQVSEVFANAHETPPKDGRLVSLISDGKLELRIIIPSKWLAWVEKGTVFEFTADDTGRSYRATIAAIGGKVDAVSQTIQAVADVENSDGKLLPGMSGEASFQVEGS